MMKNTLLLALLAVLTLSACSSSDDANNAAKDEVLYEIKDGRFTEWYPGKKRVKFEGEVDIKGNREGKWLFYSDKGIYLL